MATLPLTASGITPAVTASATSTAINVTQSAGVQVTVGVSPSGLSLYGGRRHLQRDDNADLGSRLATHARRRFSARYRGHAIYVRILERWRRDHPHRDGVYSTIDYTVTFNTTYLLTTSAKPSQGGTISPPSSGYFPANARRQSDRNRESGLYVCELDGQCSFNVEPKHNASR